MGCGLRHRRTGHDAALSLSANSYTGDGLRAWKSDASGRTYYLYDGADPVAELDSSGNLQAVNTFGAQGLVSRRTLATNASVFYTFDERGNVAQRLDSTGPALSADLYDAFGARTGTAPPGMASSGDPWGFGAQWGYQTDNETGLVLCTHRYYDPQQGRFLTRDPLGYEGGVNLYGYVGNNPVNSMDPSGLTFSPDPASKDKFWDAIAYLKKFPLANKVITALGKSTTIYSRIKSQATSRTAFGMTIGLNTTPLELTLGTSLMLAVSKHVPPSSERRVS